MQGNHIPFDIISTKVLDEKHLMKYKVLILPTLTCMSEDTANALRKYASRGGSVISTFETGLYDVFGEKRNDFIIGDLIKAKIQRCNNTC